MTWRNRRRHAAQVRERLGHRHEHRTQKRQQTFRRSRRRQRRQLLRQGRRADGAARPQRRRQDHRPAHDCRAGSAHRAATFSSAASASTTSPCSKRNIGFVFQNYALFKNMNVFKNIAFGLKIKKWKRADIEARVAELLKLLGLAGLEKRYPAPAFRRPAPARRHRPRARPQAQRAAARRTVRRGGRQNPPGTARMARPSAPRPERHHALRHPRPGGGDGSLRPHRHFLRAATSNKSARRAKFMNSPPTNSSRASSA